MTVKAQYRAQREPGTGRERRGSHDLRTDSRCYTLAADSRGRVRKESTRGVSHRTATEPASGASRRTETEPTSGVFSRTEEEPGRSTPEVRGARPLIYGGSFS